jgi:DNA-binding transcriptional MocR family regulator
VQRLVHRVVSEPGFLEKHLDELRPMYRERAEALAVALQDQFHNELRFRLPEGGMFVWCELPAGWTADRLLESALAHDVAFVPGWPFHAGESDGRTMRLSFTTHTPAEIVEGLERLRLASGSATPTGRSPGGDPTADASAPR